MPGFWDTVGDGAQQPGQFRGPGGTSAVGGLTQGSPDFWSNYFAQGAQAGPRADIGYGVRQPGHGKRTDADMAREWQMQLVQDLQRQAAGDPNSRAQQSLTAGYGQARAGQSALGSATRGTGGAAGLRQGAQGAGNVQRGYVGDQQMLMAQEQQAAQAQLAQQLAQMRGLDAMQAQGMATNALGNQSLNDAMSQFYTAGGIQTDVAANQVAADRARAAAGFDLEGQNAQAALNGQIVQAGATGAGVASRFFGSGKGDTSSGYRQVDGEDSIVPDWDK